MNNPETINRRSDKEIFFEALDKATPEERAAFLDGACGRDPVRRRRVEELLANHFQQGSFMQEPAVDGPPTVLSSIPLTEGPGTVIDRYKLLEKLGEGGFGVVYVAEQREPVRRRVALKIIKLGMDTRQVVARFEAERQALALMDHPNIAKVLDAGATETGRPYFVMELVRGVPITRYCDENHLSTEERLKLFIQICQAIQHAHQKGIIHRDIKPSNILITLHDGVPVPKVIDFGIAKATQGELTDKTVYTQFQQFIGTPAYMSPEQAEMSGLDIDTRSDIYSLGVLLYELLTGSTPFDTKELMKSGLDEMRKIIREREPIRPSTRLTQLRLTTPAQIKNQKSKIENDLDWIVMKCLEKDRTRRYESASGLVSDLQRHLNNEPVVARPPSAVYRIQKWVRRNKLAFAAATAVVAALVIGLGISTWQFIEKSRAYQQVVAAELKERSAREEAQQAEARETQLRRKAEADELAARQRAYASDMNLAQQAVAVNNLGRAWELLERYRPTQAVVSNQSSVISNQVVEPLITDFRGWEWRYLWQQCQSDASFTLCRKTNQIWSLALSHDGRWVAVATEPSQGSLSVYDLRTRQEIESLTASEGFVRAAFSPKEPLLAYSFVTDAASTNAQFGVRLWNGATRRNIGEFRIRGAANALSFSKDGQRLLIAESDPSNQLSIWRVPEGTKLASYAAPLRTSSGTPFAAADDLSIAAHRMGPDILRVVDLRTGEKRWQAATTDTIGINVLALSPDAKVLAAGTLYGDGDIRLWDAATGQVLGELHGQVDSVIALVFWPDGKTLASTGTDQTIRLWDLADLAKVPPPRIFRGHRSPGRRLALTPDGTVLVSGSADGSVFCWDTSTRPHESGPAMVPERLEAWHFGSDNKSVLVVDKQGRVARWAGADFQQMQPLLQVGTNIQDACFSGDGHWAAVGLRSGIVQVANLQKRQVAVEFQAHSGPVSPLQFLSQGKKLVIRHANDLSLHEWDLTNRRWTRALPSAPSPLFAPAGPVAFSPDERWCLTLGLRGASLLADLATGRAFSPNLDINMAYQGAFSPNGKLFAAGSRQGYSKLWETDSWQEVATLSGSAVSVVFSPDGQHVATSQRGIKLWALDSKQELLTLEGQGAGFRSTAFSADGNLLGSMNYQGVLHLWRAPSWEEIAAAEKAQK